MLDRFRDVTPIQDVRTRWSDFLGLLVKSPLCFQRMIAFTDSRPPRRKPEGSASLEGTQTSRAFYPNSTTPLSMTTRSVIPQATSSLGLRLSPKVSSALSPRQSRTSFANALNLKESLLVPTMLVRRRRKTPPRFTAVLRRCYEDGRPH